MLCRWSTRLEIVLWLGVEWRGVAGDGVWIWAGDESETAPLAPEGGDVVYKCWESPYSEVSEPEGGTVVRECWSEKITITDNKNINKYIQFFSSLPAMRGRHMSAMGLNPSKSI